MFDCKVVATNLLVLGSKQAHECLFRSFCFDHELTRSKKKLLAWLFWLRNISCMLDDTE